MAGSRIRQARGAVPTEPGEEESPQAAIARQRKKVFLFGGISSGAAVLILIVFILARGGNGPAPGTSSPENPEKNSQNTISGGLSPDQEARSRLLDIEARKKLEEFRDRLSEDPDDLLSLESELGVYSPTESTRGEFSDLWTEVAKRLKLAKKNIFSDTFKKSQEYQGQENFPAASELWKKIPAIIRGDRELVTRWREEEKKAEDYGSAWALWSNVEKKVAKYLRQDDYEISIAILECEENLPINCEILFPLIWKKREERLLGLRENLEAERDRVMAEIIAKEKREEEAQRLEEERRREELWAERLLTTSWIPLISQYGDDLENWTVRSIIWNPRDPFSSKVPWKIVKIDGQPVITAEKQEQDIEIGMNGNRWLDWVLEFDIKVDSGAVRLRSRTIIAGGVYHTIVRDGQEAPKIHEFPAARYGSWTRMRLEVRGRKVILLEGEDKKMEVRTEHQRGGFIFVFTKGSVAMIRNAQLKLVFDMDNPPEEEEKAEREGVEEDGL